MAPLAPKPGTRFVRHRGRLALFQPRVDLQEYWRDYWTGDKLDLARRCLADGDLGELASPLMRYLPREGLVLEAGCGAGIVVAALVARGHQVIGIDYEPSCIERLRAAEPGLPVEVGDITKTRFATGEIAAYISLGVIEHFEDGCDVALAEMQRIVAPGGMAFVSVPYRNPARSRYETRLAGSETLAAAELSFHQYYYSADELREMLASVGFETLELWPYAAEAFLTREHPVGARFWRSSLARERIKQALRPILRTSSAAFRRRYGHMLLAVARKT